jgi:hypothetical protein
MVITVEVGPELFRFLSFEQWVNKTARWFRGAGVGNLDVLCVDGRGRVCTCGKDFMRADDDAAFPVIAYRYRSEG